MTCHHDRQMKIDKIDQPLSGGEAKATKQNYIARQRVMDVAVEIIDAPAIFHSQTLLSRREAVLSCWYGTGDLTQPNFAERL
jgi:hypothetical protein